MKKNSTWENMIKPVVVLALICVVVSGRLAATNSVTAKIIAENAAKAADRARIAVLPDATTGFDEMETDMEGVSSMHVAKNGSGYVVASFARGYGGNIEWMTAFDNDGKIVNAKVLSQQETAGLGAKVAEEEFMSQFAGKTEELSKDNVDMISGATISSNASIKALNIARTAFNQYAKGIVAEDKGPQVTVEGNTYTATADGFIGPVSVSITFNDDGTIASATAVGNEETPEYGGAALPKLCEALVSAGSADIDVVAGATFTSNGFIEAAKAVMDAYANGTAVEAAGGEEGDDPQREAPDAGTPEENPGEPATDNPEEPVDDGSVTGTAKGFSADITAHVTFNEDGTVASVKFDVPAGDNLGQPVNESPFIDQFAGISSTEGLETIAGATFSSQGAIDAVQNAIDSNK